MGHSKGVSPSYKKDGIGRFYNDIYNINCLRKVFCDIIFLDYAYLVHHLTLSNLFTMY